MNQGQCLHFFDGLLLLTISLGGVTNLNLDGQKVSFTLYKNSENISFLHNPS